MKRIVGLLRLIVMGVFGSKKEFRNFAFIAQNECAHGATDKSTVYVVNDQ